MNEICPINLCTGCMSCLNVCNHNAIRIVQDNEGFYKPEIDTQKCINCGLCMKRCPNNVKVNLHKPIKIYSGWINNNNLRIQSSSGGAFTALAIPVIENKGIVFGAMLNKELKVMHTFIEEENELEVLRGSKYVQSNIEYTFQKVKSFLQLGRLVLFSGTPCQISGLRSFLNKDYENLITVDLICHGVPSPMVFEDWKKWFISRNQLSSLTSIKFRGKEKSWIFYNMEVLGSLKSGKHFQYIGEYHKDVWIRGFLRDYFLRPSCYECKYAQIDRCSDITIADMWGYIPRNKKYKDFEQKGVSLIMCNTQKGFEYFSKNCKKNMILESCSIEDAYKTNKALKEPSKRPMQREQFWIDYHRYSFNDIVKKYMQPEKIPLYLWLRINLRPSLVRRILCSVLYRIEKLKLL